MAANSIAVFQRPLKAVRVSDNLPRIIIATGTADDVAFFMAVNMDGGVELLSVGEVLVDWRYDPKTEMWDDVGATVASGPFGEEL